MKQTVHFDCGCPGCNVRLRIEFINEPAQTGAMSTVDCPVCGASKIVPSAPVGISYYKDANWIESRPRTHHTAS